MKETPAPATPIVEPIQGTAVPALNSITPINAGPDAVLPGLPQTNQPADIPGLPISVIAPEASAPLETALVAPALVPSVSGGPGAASPAPSDDGGSLARAAPATRGIEKAVTGVQDIQSHGGTEETASAAADGIFREGSGATAAAASAKVLPFESGARSNGLVKPASPDEGFDEETVHEVFLRVLNAQIEGAAADAHDVGWKKAKDQALVDQDDPFLGWAPTRLRVSEELKGKSRSELEAVLGRPISERKFQAIQKARIGQDVTHPLYKPYEEMLRHQADGGLRLAGQNALPLLVLTLYLSDMRRADTLTKPGFNRVLQGLISGEDKKGVAEVSRMMHIAFQGAQLVYGERGFERDVNGAKIPARGDFKPFDDLHRDVQELDTYTLLPAAKWLLDHGAGLAQREPLHAFSELLTLGPDQFDDLPILPSRDRLLVLRARAARFSSDYGQAAAQIKSVNTESAAAAQKAPDQAKAIKARAQNEKSRLLWALADSYGLAGLHPEELTTLFLAFKDQGLFADMIKLYDGSASVTFRRATTIREFLAVALHKTGNLARSESVIRRLGDARMSGEAHAILGKINKLRSLELSAAGDKEQSLRALEQSIQDLERGFLKDFEFYPGVNLVYNMITDGAERGDVEKIAQAQRLAQLVYLSASKAGGLESGDFWTAATMLESAVITGRDDEIASALPRVLAKASAEWEVQAPIDNLERLRGQAAALGERWPGSSALIVRLDAALTALRERLKTIHQSPAIAQAEPAVEPSVEARKAARLFAIGFRFGEIKSNDVGGNIDFGGQLHAEVANRWDFAVAREILRYKGLENPETDFATFNRTIDALIRERFGTDSLEDLHSAEHQAFDEFTKTLLDTMGVEKGQDSRTNIMVDFWLGKGDCRHHAYVKQLFFDIWKTDKINALMAQAYGQLKTGDLARYKGTIALVHDWENLHMLTLDSVVRAPIMTTQKYHPVLALDGTPVRSADGVLNDVEDHTWNLLFKVNDRRELVEALSVDSFYQHVYPFGGGAGVPLPLSSIGLDGTIVAGRPIATQNVTTGQEVHASVALVPTSYAGQAKRIKADTGDYGERVLLRGIPIDELAKRDGRPDVSGYFDPLVKNGIERFAERMRRESRAAVVARLENAVPGLEVVGDAAPPIEQWKGEIMAIMKQGAIPERDFNSVVALLEVGVDETRPGRQTAFRVRVKPGASTNDPAGWAAARVAALATPVIGMSAPRLERWPQLRAWIEQAFSEVSPGTKATAHDLDEIRGKLVLVSSASGRRFYVRLRPALKAAAN